MLVEIDGRVLKKLREEKHVTQEVLGELIQHSRQAIANIENDITKSTDDKNLNALAKFFNVSPMELQGYQNTSEEQTLEDEKQALTNFVFRVIQGELRETDMNTLFSIANFFDIDREHAQKIIDNKNCKITVPDKTKTVLKSPFTQGNYREQISNKINLLSKSKLPALGRIIDYVNNCDVDQVHQVEKLCEIISSYTPLDVLSNKNISDYILLKHLPILFIKKSDFKHSKKLEIYFKSEKDSMTIVIESHFLSLHQ